jgi:hypothetical protein
LATLIVAAKYLNDSSPKNKHWTRYGALFSLAEVSLMEKQLLYLLDYDLRMSEDELLLHFAPFLPKPRATSAATTLGVGRPHHAMRMPSLESCASSVGDSPMPVTPKRGASIAIPAHGLATPSPSPTRRSASEHPGDMSSSPRHVTTRAGVRQRISPPSSVDLREAVVMSASASAIDVPSCPAPAHVVAVGPVPKRKLSRSFASIPSLHRRSSVEAQLGLPFSKAELAAQAAAEPMPTLRSQRSSGNIMAQVRGYWKGLGGKDGNGMDVDPAVHIVA